MATDLEDERQAIFGRFQDGLGDLPVAYPNQKFDQPKGEAWLRVTLRRASTAPVSLGNPGAHTVRTQGIMFVQIFLPLDRSGTKEAYEIGDRIADCFDLEVINTTNGDIEFETFHLDEVGERNGFYQFNGTVRYRRDVINR